MRRCAGVLAVVLTVPALAGCGSAVPDAPPPRDPVVVTALNDPVMTDPDLVGQSQSGTLFTLTGPPSAPMPLLDRSDRELDAARAAAARQLGNDVQPAPPPGPGLVSAPGPDLAGTAKRTLAELGLPKGCAGSLRRSALWAANLPEALPIYPRGHVQHAAGSDMPGCHLRVVRFVTPVPLGDIADFYWNLAGQADLAPRLDQTATGVRIAGMAGQTGFAAFATERAGDTEVTLLTCGF